MTGLPVFLRAFARRDHWFVISFVAGITLLYWSQAPGVDGIYTTRAAFEEAAAMMESNAAFIAMAGPPRALDTTGGQVAWQASAFGAVCAGLMSMFLVGRHTRAEEESGRDELMRSGAVSRRTPMTAALLMMLVANLLVGAGVAASLVAYGLAVAGAVALGVGVWATGAVFGAVALLAMQLTGSTRTAYGITGTVIGVSYALRAVGDVSGGTLSWLSPIGWYQAMHAYSGEQWWPLLLLIAAAVVLVAAAYAAFDRRDFGAGLWHARPGPQHAGPGLQSALGLNWRLQRGSVLGWVIGMLLGGIAYGSIGDDVDSLIGDSELSRDIFLGGAGALVDAFYATAALMVALIAAGFTVSSALRPREEEDSGRLEVLLATSLPRRRWWAGNVLITTGGSLVAVGAAGAGMGVGYALVTGDWSRVGQLTVAALVMLPGVLVLGGLGLLLVGLRPAWSVVAWLPLGFCAVVLLFGELLRFPDWVVDLSPFSHLGRYPAEDVPWGAVGVVLGVALALAGLALWAFGRRDVVTR
jgi:ABC-2 type transport system permease protein